MASSSMVTIKRSHAFGLKADVGRNIGFLGDGKLVYPVGDTVVAYTVPQEPDNNTNTQRFIDRKADEAGQGITAMAVSERYIAVAEYTTGAPIINVYDTIKSMSRRKNFVANDILASEYLSLDFDKQNQHRLITLSGRPDHVLAMWEVNKASNAPLATQKVATGKDDTATMCSFAPHNSELVCVSGGNSLVKLYKLDRGVNGISFKYEGPNRVSTSQKVEPQNYLSHCWVTDELLVLGTDNGQLALVNGRELTYTSLPFDPAHNHEPLAITSIVAYSRGFIIGCDQGRVIIYEKDDKDGGDAEGTQYVTLFNLDLPDKSCIINHLAIGSLSGHGESELVCTTNTAQIYMLRDLGSFVVKDVEFEPLSQSFHSGPITGMDVCIRKALVATCSVDKTVRIWNYETNTLEIVEVFQEEAYSVALHPSGLQILVGFQDRLKLMNLVDDHIVPVHDFVTCRGCKEVQFSHGGQYFAAVKDTVAHVYNTYTYEPVCPLKGHSHKIRSLFWTADDLKIISAGQDGTIYEWRLAEEAKRVDMRMEKACAYSCVVRTYDGRTIYAVGSDRKLKEISADGNETFRDIDTGGALYTQIALSRRNRMMVAGTNAGRMRSIQYPPPPEPMQSKYTDEIMHAKEVTRVRFSYDEKYLFSSSDDGSLFICEVRESGTDALNNNEPVPEYSQEILVTRKALKERDDRIRDLEQQLVSEQQAHQYDKTTALQALKNKEEDNKSILQQQVNELHTQLQTREEELQNKERVFQREKERLEENCNRAIERAAHDSEEMMIANQNSYNTLEAEKLAQATAFASQLDALKKSNAEHEEEIRSGYEEEIRRLNSLIEQKDKRIDADRKEYEETQRQVEEDADEEIQVRINHYNQMLLSRDEANGKLKGQVGIMRKEFKQLKKAIEDEAKDKRAALDNAKRLAIERDAKVKEINELIKELQDRDAAIKDKEAHIHELKKKNQELEKFKFVLEYKNKEQQRQLEPREDQIDEQLKQINDMDAELEKYFNTNKNLIINVEDLKLKVKALEREILVQRSRLNDAAAITRRFRTDLHVCVQNIQDPKALKESVKELYKRHVTLQVQDAGIDVDIQRENNRQREYLERSVASLKSKLAKDSLLHKADNARIMHENVSLIKEINELRRELKALKQAQRGNRSSLVLGDGASYPLDDGGEGGSRGVLRGRAEDSLPPLANALLDQKKQQIKALMERVQSLEEQQSNIASGFLPPLGRTTSSAGSDASSIHGVMSSVAPSRPRPASGPRSRHNAPSPGRREGGQSQGGGVGGGDEGVSLGEEEYMINENLMGTDEGRRGMTAGSSGGRSGGGASVPSSAGSSAGRRVNKIL